jgi:Uma2 family endonuclease
MKPGRKRSSRQTAGRQFDAARSRSYAWSGPRPLPGPTAMSTTALMTEEEYLELDRGAERGVRYEFRDGVVVRMAGASFRHCVITGNLVGELRNKLKHRPCRVCPSDARVHVPATRLYTYADALVVCGEPRFRDGRFDTLLNPVLLIEVLSPSTAAYDRGQKLAQYRTIEGLAEILLVSQDEPRVDRHSRDGDRWSHAVVTGLAAVVLLTSVDCPLELAEIYDKVSFG